MFHRQPKNPLLIKTKPLERLVKYIPAPQFLADDKRAQLITKIKQLMKLEPSRYESLCTLLKENLVNYAQSLPGSSNSYYSTAGGLIDFSLNRAEAALSLFQEFMILDENGTLSEIQKLWQYALYSAAILQGIGKLFTDYSIHIYDSNGKVLELWNPLIESLNSTGSNYSYEFKKEADVEFKKRLNLLLAKAIMPPSGFAWIASNSEVLNIWLALLDEDYLSAGTLGAILIRAEAVAIQRYILEHMAGKNLPQGKHFGGIGTFSGGTPEALNQKKQALGLAFIEWMVKAFDSGILMINKAPLHMVPGGMLMCQEVFELFCRLSPTDKFKNDGFLNWRAVRESFLLLGLHKKGSESEEMRFINKQTHEIEKGIVFEKYPLALSEKVKVVSNDKIETMSALKLINSQLDGNFIVQKQAGAAFELQKMPPSGKWQAEVTNNSSLGFTRGV